VPDNELSTELIEGEEGNADDADDEDNDVEMTTLERAGRSSKVTLRGNDGNATDRLTEGEFDRLMHEGFGGEFNRSESTAMTTDAQRWWKRCSMLGGQQYYPPGRGQVAKDFISIFTATILALAQKEQPSDWIIICQVTLLQRSKGVTQTADIKRLLERRINMWRNKEYEALVQEAERCNKELQAVAKAKRGKPMDKDQTAGIFAKKVFEGKIRDAVRFITDQANGGVLDVTDEITVKGKTGTVREILEAKHPPAMMPLRAALMPRPTDEDGRETELPPLIDVDITASDIESIARRLRGGGGPGGMDSSVWSRLLLHYGTASANLREAVAELARAMTNTLFEPDEEQRLLSALLANRLVALDKCPGVRPIGIGECLRRLIAKVVAQKTKHEVVAAAKEDQLATSLPAAIEGGAHAMREQWEKLADEEHEEGYGMLLVDASNAFNALNRGVAMWNLGGSTRPRSQNPPRTRKGSNSTFFRFSNGICVLCGSSFAF
jgi:hypothetical protein